MVSILPVRGYCLSDCHFTWDSPEMSFTLSKQRPDQINLGNITLKNICCFTGKTHVYETAWSLTFFIIRSSLPVGEVEILHASEVGWICYSTQGNYCSSRKRAYLYWMRKGKHWGHLFVKLWASWAELTWRFKILGGLPVQVLNLHSQFLRWSLTADTQVRFFFLMFCIKMPQTHPVFPSRVWGAIKLLSYCVSHLGLL